ncbi:hypothetical protein [Natranaeroarchaeum sulfidigenes]|uniref:Putative acyltransferase n=1 Tax=Natranaeroarchaeum sulfidigenes TaxID=2784880 RepID=A0A897MMA6_9EURY|nr:hypothetical protein [Natranaeroarchaeum sulfidigenes]QSG01727.1 putative acyltransferase [Natranaeroarchaeum sulfidigenes]
MADLSDTRAIVDESEVYEGQIIPTVQSEIGRDVTVGPDAVVTDGIYGNDVAIESGARVEASVMGRTGVELDECEVYGDVGADGRITGIDAYTHSSVSGTTIRLQNCVIRGNVVGTTVRLENCLVLGIAAAERELVLEDSLCYTFKAPGGGECSGSQVLLPQAVAGESFTIADPISVIGLPISNEDSSEIELTDEDRVEYDEQTYLTIADRVLDLDGIEDRIETLEAMLREVVDEAEAASEADLRATVAAALDIDEERLP